MNESMAESDNDRWASSTDPVHLAQARQAWEPPVKLDTTSAERRVGDIIHRRMENLADKLNGPIDLEKIELLGVAPTVWDKTINRAATKQYLRDCDSVHYPRQSGFTSPPGGWQDLLKGIYTFGIRRGRWSNGELPTTRDLRKLLKEVTLVQNYGRAGRDPAVAWVLSLTIESLGLALRMALSLDEVDFSKLEQCGPAGKNELLGDMLRELQRVVASDDGEAARSENRCIMSPLGCGRPLSETCDHSRCLEGQYFHTEAALREYRLTGMCQACQDQFFAKKVVEE